MVIIQDFHEDFRNDFIKMSGMIVVFLFFLTKDASKLCNEVMILTTFPPKGEC